MRGWKAENAFLALFCVQKTAAGKWRVSMWMRIFKKMKEGAKGKDKVLFLYFTYFRGGALSHHTCEAPCHHAGSWKEAEDGKGRLFGAQRAGREREHRGGKRFVQVCSLIRKRRTTCTPQRPFEIFQRHPLSHTQLNQS